MLSLAGRGRMVRATNDRTNGQCNTQVSAVATRWQQPFVIVERVAPISRIGILTGGGDAPGLNAVIRAVVKTAYNAGIQCVGLEDSFDGLIEPGRSRVLTPRDVTGILRLGGTILGTTNRGNPFAYPIDTSAGTRDYSDRVVEMFHQQRLDALVVIGGDGTLAIAHQFCLRGIPIVGVPKTIDNDIVGTTNCFGFDTAVDFATDAIDRLHTTAEAHRRIMVVEVMGRYAGWIALYAGVAGGADAILIPEIPFDLTIVADRLIERDKWGARFSIVVAAEGAAPTGGKRALLEEAHEGHVERLGGIGASVCQSLAQLTGKETRSVVLGHLQRGGAPTSFDRVLATRFGGKAVELVKRGEFGTMVAFDPPDIVARRLEEIVSRTKTIPMDFDLLLTAKALGVTFGD
jgi:ATP-dependent phosphofructokinase / diphosphate-dependent phosphofructokinase